MPAITSGKVLVTGANGFIAGWIIKGLFERGLSVRGTVRSLAKAEGLREKLAAHAKNLEFTVVPDITPNGAFDQAVKGIDAIIHVASPVHVNAKDPEEVIRPAVDGTTSILRSASAADSTVRRIVFVSSLAAVVDSRRGTPVVYTEDIWNETDPPEVEKKGADVHPSVMYRTSKTLAEKAAWDAYREGQEKGSISWDLVSLCPPWVFGPHMDAKSPDELHTSMKQWYDLCVREEGELPTWSKGLSWTDVRDFATAAVASVTLNEAGGKRFIICAGPYGWDQWTVLVRRLLGKTSPESEEVPQADTSTIFDATRSIKVLGLQYHSMEDTASYIIEDFKARGWC